MNRLPFLPLLVFVVCSCQKSISTAPENAPVSASLNSDSKQAAERPYRDSFCTSYQFIPGDGWVFPNPGPGYYPGKGKGYASYIGKATTYFNSYVAGPPDFLSGPASVNLFFAKKLKPYNVPDAANSVVVDDKGNSIWFAATSLVQYPVSETRIEFSGTADIIGGSGKFKNASGSVILNGFFNPIDPTDAGVGSKGTIIY
jgi:hypothetical protein